jgi:hypothetical protein
MTMNQKENEKHKIHEEASDDFFEKLNRKSLWNWGSKDCIIKITSVHANQVLIQLNLDHWLQAFPATLLLSHVF